MVLHCNSASCRTSCLLIVVNLQLSTNKSDLMLVFDNTTLCQTNSHYYGFGEKVCLREVQTKCLFTKPKSQLQWIGWLLKGTLKEIILVFTILFLDSILWVETSFTCSRKSPWRCTYYLRLAFRLILLHYSDWCCKLSSPSLINTSISGISSGKFSLSHLRPRCLILTKLSMSILSSFNSLVQHNHKKLSLLSSIL